MKKFEISAEELAKVSIARLASHPNSSTAYGTRKMSAEALKAQFDKQGELFRAKFNAFLAIIGAKGDEESLAEKVLTGISEDHTLKVLFEDIVSEAGRFASYLSVGDMTLAEKLVEIGAMIDKKTAAVATSLLEHEQNNAAEFEEIRSTAQDERKRVDGIDQRLTAAEGEIGGLDERMEAAEGDVAELGERMGSAEGDVAELYEHMSVAQEDIGELEGRMGLAEDGLSELGADALRKKAAGSEQVVLGAVNFMQTVRFGSDVVFEGDATTADKKVLTVEDALIVVNSGGVASASLKGYVIRTGVKDYGIAYDPDDDALKLGLGEYVESVGEDGKKSVVFTFSDGQAQSILTRGVLGDGHLLRWDASQLCAVDAGRATAGRLLMMDAEGNVVDGCGEVSDGHLIVWDALRGQYVDCGKSLSDIVANYEAYVNTWVASRGENGTVKVADAVDGEDAVNLRVMERETSNPLIGEAVGDPAVIPDAVRGPLSVVTPLTFSQADGVLSDSGEVQEPSPENVRAISGVTGAVLRRSGGNLFDVPARAADPALRYLHYVNVSVEGNAVKVERTDAEGTAVMVAIMLGDASQYLGKEIFVSAKVRPSTTVAKGMFGLVLRNQKINKNMGLDFYTKQYTGSTDEATLSRTKVIPEDTEIPDGYELALMLYADNASSITTQQAGDFVTYSDIMISLADIPYEPFVGNDAFEIDFGQEVVGGRFDWGTGVLTLDRVKHTFTDSDSWIKATTQSSYDGIDSRNRYAYAPAGIVKWSDANAVDDSLICSRFKTVTAGVTLDNGNGISNQNGRVYIYWEDYATDFEGFKQAIVGTEIVYRLAEPITVQLTPTDVRALEGVNAVWCDAGDCSVSYNRDINVAVNELWQAINKLITYHEEG